MIKIKSRFSEQMNSRNGKSLLSQGAGDCIEQVQICSASFLIKRLSNIHNAENGLSAAKHLRFCPFWGDYALFLNLIFLPIPCLSRSVSSYSMCFRFSFIQLDFFLFLDSFMQNTYHWLQWTQVLDACFVTCILHFLDSC